MSDSVRLFSIRSVDYAQFRPSYPESLFSWLAEQCPRTRCALDVAAGSGQATLPLLGHFDRVLSCDASPDQLSGSADWQSVQRFAAQAERLPLCDGRVDLMVVAQALHWFATPAFFAEAKRVLDSNGLFCAWCYSLLRIDPALDEVISRLHGETLQGYWPRGRESVDAGYQDIRAPFETIEPPEFAIEVHWNLPQLLGYLRTWSAVKQWQQAYDMDPVAQLEPDLAQRWGDPERQRRIRWPLHFLAGYPGR
ncbi:class I SAM-dependent methyltransferase [Pseudomonas sp. KSR10]|uniref:class I SAM-dependent methyltransferase n=1 Tax=Pseudomonas sp. KSR10 TaxID=2916654 RepID=UPI001EF8C1B9|nr:class I SAM-dependent methyltransferase [Pseudomonas sp. KSR10]MCG6540044.1 class I SAM-dependent methyltransferase [Pseudomonas sp. KSR10]